MRRFFLFNTGCIRRGLDTIRLHDYLVANGWQYTGRVGQADLLILTTCGAVQEKEDGSINALAKLVRRRASGARIVVSGCLPRINPASIEALGEFEYAPIGELGRLDDLLGARVKLDAVPEAHSITSNRYVLNYVLAYRLFRNSARFIPLFNRLSMQPGFLELCVLIAKGLNVLRDAVRLRRPHRIVPYYNISISEGCVGQCSYCAIRFATGRQRSKSPERVVAEFEGAVAAGHRFIQLVAEDTGCYGLDIGTTFPDLLRRLLAVAGDYKLIVIDCNPRWLVKYRDELVPLLEGHQDRVHELFVPIQSGSDAVLGRMNRYYRIDEVRAALLEVRRRAPRIRLRTTLIVGFPGESEADFQHSVRLVEEVDFYEVTLNKYEDRPGAASSGLGDKVAAEVIARCTRELELIA